MAPSWTVKKFATRPRALLRSTLTAPPSAKSRRLGIACGNVSLSPASALTKLIIRDSPYCTREPTLAGINVGRVC
jgi:hypothetical protein